MWLKAGKRPNENTVVLHRTDPVGTARARAGGCSQQPWELILAHDRAASTKGTQLR